MNIAQAFGFVVLVMSNNWVNAHPMSTIVDSGDILAITIAFTIQMIGVAIIMFSAD